MHRPLSRVLTSTLVALALFAVAIGTGSGFSVPSALAQEAASDAPAGAPAMDVTLYRALNEADLVGPWLEASTVSDEASFLSVVPGGSSYATLRAELLDGLASLGRRNGNASDRLQRAQALELAIAGLDGVAAALEFALHAQVWNEAAVFSPEVVKRAAATLAELDNAAHHLGFSREPLAIAESHADGLRSQLELQVAVLGVRGNQARRTVQEEQLRLSDVRDQLDQLHLLAISAQSQAEQDRAAIEPAIAELVATFPELDRLRKLAPTTVDGLPLVTIDAYLRGADGLGACPVDWSLLAGIGRVESRHGTLDDRTVGASGRVSLSIFGPLLDGGATEREAEEAAALAEAEALAEELAAAAEAEAAAQWLDPQIWGEPEEELPEDDVHPLYGLIEEPEEEVDPLYGDLYLQDPDRARLDDSDGEDESEDGEASDEDEQDEEEPEGNGFAVIEDTDNGRLDGNDRWDRAVGPMQFIPETWSNWGTDGDGDGVADPQNIYDAARSAGRFLCDLSKRRGASPEQFVLGYNSSSTYVRTVMSFAASYRISDLSLPEAG